VRSLIGWTVLGTAGYLAYDHACCRIGAELSRRRYRRQLLAELLDVVEELSHEMAAADGDGTGPAR
jgi:hypothetical protein